MAPSGARRLAVVVEPDPLLRLHAEAAARALDFVPAGEAPLDGVRLAAPAAVFVGLDAPDACRRCGPGAAADVAGPAALTLGYTAGATELLAAHRVHACCDVVLALRAVAGRARFVYPPDGGLVADARLTAREADVLVLLLGGLSTADVAVSLCVASATARSHCRALLRKFGAPNRRALRARLLGTQSGAFGTAGGVPFGALR